MLRPSDFIYVGHRTAGRVAGVGGAKGTNGQHLARAHDPRLSTVATIADFFGVSLEMAAVLLVRRRDYWAAGHRNHAREHMAYAAINAEFKRQDAVTVRLHDMLNAAVALHELPNTKTSSN